MPPTLPARSNVQTIIDLERATLESRTTLARMTDTVSAVASSPAFIVLHLVWFAGWIGVNLTHHAVFDPFPFNLLSLVVSLEAIVLTGFVLMAQSRMTLQAEKRAHLDLQINLLAEQELTAILRLQCLLAEHAGIDVASADSRLEQFVAQMDVRTLSDALDEELAAMSSPAAHTIAPTVDTLESAFNHEHTQEEPPMNRDELEGKVETLKGKMKQAAGDLTNDQDLHDEGVAQEAAGQTQDAFGRAKRIVGEVLEDIGKAVKK
jgi:uncharacterized membrane protein/uncharacterized protein YjbJ (UPF0337 family)